MIIVQISYTERGDATTDTTNAALDDANAGRIANLHTWRNDVSSPVFLNKGVARELSVLRSINHVSCHGPVALHNIVTLSCHATKMSWLYTADEFDLFNL